MLRTSENTPLKNQYNSRLAPNQKIGTVECLDEKRTLFNISHFVITMSSPKWVRLRNYRNSLIDFTE